MTRGSQSQIFTYGQAFSNSNISFTLKSDGCSIYSSDSGCHFSSSMCSNLSSMGQQARESTILLLEQSSIICWISTGCMITWKKWQANTRPIGYLNLFQSEVYTSDPANIEYILKTTCYAHPHSPLQTQNHPSFWAYKDHCGVSFLDFIYERSLMLHSWCTFAHNWPVFSTSLPCKEKPESFQDSLRVLITIIHCKYHDYAKTQC